MRGVNKINSDVFADARTFHRAPCPSHIKSHDLAAFL